MKATIAAVSTAFLAVILQQVGQLREGRNPLLHLRTEFWHDQLGYLAIAADVARGHFDNSEPVTMTGVSHYPRFYYSAVGAVARVTSLPTVVSWNLVSFALQFAAVLAVSLVIAGLARRWWAAFAGALPFFTGTFAYAIAGRENAWYTLLDAHAVMWGPFGVLFSNNAETAGLCVGVIALSAFVWVWRPGCSRRLRIIVTLLGAAGIGALSSFQTYSFLTFAYLATFAAAVAGIAAARRRMPLIVVSAALVLVVFLAGPLLAGRIGQLPTLIFGMLPAIPGFVIAVIRTRGLIAWAAGAAVAAALPQVSYTMTGMLTGDPFLSYRVASNHLLGIVSWQALLGASVVLVALVGSVVAASITRDRLAVVVASTALVVMPFLAVNDVWGANAEPYRFWIEGILLGGIAACFVLARLVGVIRPAARGRAADREGAVGGSRPLASTVLAATIIASAMLWAAALPDWVNSLRDDQMQATWNPYTSRETAIETLARAASSGPTEGLITTERCIDNRTMKANSGSPVANYHLGMAWPVNRDAIDAIIEARDDERLDIDAMRESDTKWVLTDSSCSSNWENEYAGQLQRVDSRDYRIADDEVISDGSQTDGRITLWRLDD